MYLDIKILSLTQVSLAFLPGGSAAAARWAVPETPEES